MGRTKYNLWLGVLLVVLVVTLGLLYVYYQKKAKIDETGVAAIHVGKEYRALARIEAYRSASEDSHMGYLPPQRTFLVLRQEGEWWNVVVTGITVPTPAENQPTIAPWQGWIKYEPEKIKIIN